MYKNRFGINNLQWLMCHETKPRLLLSGIQETRNNPLEDINDESVNLGQQEE